MTTPVSVPSAPPLSRLAGVELMRTGQWDISTGTATFTTDDLAAAVAALECPAVRRPVLKLGHTDPRFDGEPAAGWIDNLATASDGHTLLGDYVGMPGWLGPILASAYPDRSIEGWFDFSCQLGHVHPFVLTGVALLGVTAPGIGTLASLQDVAAMYGVAAAVSPPGGTPVALTVRAARGGGMPHPSPTPVAAGVTTEDVRRAYYDDAPWSVWIEEFHLDPLQLIVIDDQNGKRSRVPVLVAEGDGEDAVSFGEAVPVVVRYEDAPQESVAAAAAAGRIRYASRAESRPGTTNPAAAPAVSDAPAQENGGPAVAFSDEQLTTMRQELGLPADADEATIAAAVSEALTERAEPVEPVPAPALPEGTVAIDAAQLEQLQVAARRGEAAHVRQEREDREAAVAAAIESGRIPPARREHWLAQLEKDPGAAETLASLAPGLIPVGKPIGHAAAAAEDPARKDDYWFPGVVSTSTSREG